jgi:4-diphosphocytidyl-2-C-methyl-D-erythritol kinase
MRFALGLLAPAKLNLFLHVIGRRDDGYHELQSVFVPIDLADTIDLEVRDDGVLQRDGDIVGDLDRDLALRAARGLQVASCSRLGAIISIAKRIPAGSGLGGGSSDAATTLLALNRLWRLDWPRARLAELAGTLGADVPFFLGSGPAFVSGKGDRVQSLAAAPAGPSGWPIWAVVLWPQVHVSTTEIFAAPGLTRNHKATTIRAFSEAWTELLAGAQAHAQTDASSRAKSVRPLALTPLFGSNDLQEETSRRYPAVAAALQFLEQFGTARMTGSGAAAFALFASESDAREVQQLAPPACRRWVVRILEQHPMAPW